MHGLEYARLMRARVPLLAALLCVMILPDAAVAQQAEIEAAVFRTRQPPNLTVVEGLLEFDPSLDEGSCAYELAIDVDDATGSTIHSERWRAGWECQKEEVSPTSARQVRVVETFRFAVVPGDYSVKLSVAPESQPDRVRSVELPLRGLPLGAVASDLILAREVGLADSTGDRPWTLRRGQIGLAADPKVVADTARPTLAYYLEVYPQALEAAAAEPVMAGLVTAVIRSADGREMARLRLEQLEPTTESRALAGTISLAGLPPGEYGLEVRLGLEDTVISRSRDFSMAWSAPLVVKPVLAARTPAAVEGSDSYFWRLSDDELAELFDPVVVWLSSAKQRELYEGLAPDGRRRFLERFFDEYKLGGEDQSEEAALDVYLSRVRHVNEAFGERAGVGEQAGWRTDRGRIYLLRGKPDETRRQAFPTDETPPFEIWYYQVGRGYLYVFVDETRFQHYRLVFSTDPSFPALPDWIDRAGPGTLEELERYYSIRPRLPS